MRKFLLLFVLLSLGVMAESTMYVGGDVKIPMRTDDSFTEGNIIYSLDINTPVALIKKQDNGWSNIRYKGKEGVIISRYLTDKKPENSRAEKLQKDLDFQKKINKDSFNNNYAAKSKLKDQIQAHKNEISSLKLEVIENNTKILEINKLRNKLLSLDGLNNDLVEQLALTKAENKSLHTTDFMTILSTITLLLGLALGVSFSRASNNRHNKMYSL